jgi:hypothetical protein
VLHAQGSRPTSATLLLRMPPEVKSNAPPYCQSSDDDGLRGLCDLVNECIDAASAADWCSRPQQVRRGAHRPAAAVAKPRSSCGNL